jgi:hypothetical protein
MKFRIPSLTICLLLIVGGLAGTVRSQAQATTASIHGTVTDSSGALLSSCDRDSCEHEHKYFRHPEDRQQRLFHLS